MDEGSAEEAQEALLLVGGDVSGGRPGVRLVEHLVLLAERVVDVEAPEEPRAPPLLDARVLLRRLLDVGGEDRVEAGDVSHGVVLEHVENVGVACREEKRGVKEK